MAGKDSEPWARLMAPSLSSIGWRSPSSARHLVSKQTASSICSDNRLPAVRHPHRGGVVGAVTVDDVNFGAAQLQLKLLKKQRGDYRHLVLGKVHPRALVDAAAEAHDRKCILSLAALGRPAQRIEVLRVREDIRQEMRVGRVDDHPPALGQLVAAHAQRLFHRAHLQIRRRADAGGLVNRPGLPVESLLGRSASLERG